MKLNRLYILLVVIILSITFSCNTEEEKKIIDDKKMVLTNGFIVIDTFPSGAPKTTYQRNLDDTTRTMVEVYHENGAMNMKGEVVNDKREGQWMVWDEKHNLLTMGNYVNGVEEGEKTVWYPNGVKYYEGAFKNGEKAGIWKFYKEDGSLAEEKNYDKK